MAHPVNWFQIQGPDGRTLQAFYKGVFGWPMSEMPGSGDMAMVPAQPPDGIPGGVGTSQNKQPSVTVYITVGDIDAYLGKIERAGGHIAMPKMPLPNDMGFIAGFTDPASNWIGLWQAPPKAAPPPARKGPKKAAAAPKKKAAPAAKKAAPKKGASASKKKAAAPPKKKAGKRR
jgi:hypothetical protein